jgi:hypothetical protein
MSGASFVWRVTAVLHTNHQLRAKAALVSLHCSFPQTVYWEWEQQWVLWCHLQRCFYADGRVSLSLPFAELGIVMRPVFLPRMNMELRWKSNWQGKTKFLGQNLSQSHSLHHRYHKFHPGNEPGTPSWETGYWLVDDFKVKTLIESRRKWGVWERQRERETGRNRESLWPVAQKGW